MDEEENIQHFYDLAREARKFSPELSKTMVSEMLQSIKESNKPIPEYFKKLLCYKCFSLFEIGKNCKVAVHSNKKHPNLKIVEYHCLDCKNTQRINCLRAKKVVEKQLEPQKIKEISPKHEFNKSQTNPKIQQKRKLFTNIFG